MEKRRYRIASFNIQEFGTDGMKDINERVKKIKGILLNNNVDIVAIQEAINPYAIELLINTLGGTLSTRKEIPCRGHIPSMRYKAGNWEAYWAKPKSKIGSANAEEGYAFMWNNRNISLARDKKNREIHPRIVYEYKKSKSSMNTELCRPPFYARFLTDNKIYEFRLINTHILGSKTKKIQGREDDAGVSYSDIKYRNGEFHILTESILSKIGEKGGYDGLYHEEACQGKNIYTFLLGDYNLNLPDSDGEDKSACIFNPCIYLNEGKQAIVTVQRALTTIRNKSKIAFIGNPELSVLRNNYDHFSYDENKRRIMNLNYVPSRLGNEDWMVFKDEVSDHIPIFLDIELA